MKLFAQVCLASFDFEASTKKDFAVLTFSVLLEETNTTNIQTAEACLAVW